MQLELKFLVYGRARCERSSSDHRIPPVCRNYKSGNSYIHGYRCLCRQAEGEKKPSKKSKNESAQGAVAILKEKSPRLCISQFRSKEVNLRKAGLTRLNPSAGHAVKILRTHLVRSSNLGKKRAISRRYPKR